MKNRQFYVTNILNVMNAFSSIMTVFFFGGFSRIYDYYVCSITVFSDIC